jgi:RND family efflux transporter MFP subunit
VRTARGSLSPRLLLILGAAAVLLGLLGWVARLGIAGLLAQQQVALEEVRRGRFLRVVTAEGDLKAVNVTAITVPTDTDGPQKVAWLAIDGSAVKAGDPVVLFDPYDAQKKLTDGRSDRQSAQRKIEKTTADSESTLKGLTLDSKIATQELERAEDFAPKDPRLFSRNEIVESEIDRGLLEKRSEAASVKAEASKKRWETELALNEIERQKAEIRIRQAERGLSSLRVLAPHDGFIAFERNWRGEMLTVGETAWPGQKIAEIPDLESLEARVFVLEADAGGLKPGCPATMRIQGQPGVEYAAEVSRVEAMAKSRDWRVPTKYFEAILTLEMTDQEVMKPGQTVRAKIVLEDLDEVISVPRQAVFEKDDERVVYRLQGGTLEAVEVEVGQHSLSRVVIEKGLEPGDRIALRDPSLLASEIFSGKGEPGTAAGGSESGS